MGLNEVLISIDGIMIEIEINSINNIIRNFKTLNSIKETEELQIIRNPFKMWRKLIFRNPVPKTKNTWFIIK